MLGMVISDQRDREKHELEMECQEYGGQMRGERRHMIGRVETHDDTEHTPRESRPWMSHTTCVHQRMGLGGH